MQAAATGRVSPPAGPSPPFHPEEQPIEPTTTRAPGRKLGLADIQDTGSGLPSRIVVYGTEGIGKTSLGASAPRTIFLMTRGETGLLTLLDSGRIPPTPHFPEILDLVRAARRDRAS